MPRAPVGDPVNSVASQARPGSSQLFPWPVIVLSGVKGCLLTSPQEKPFDSTYIEGRHLEQCPQGSGNQGARRSGALPSLRVRVRGPGGLGVVPVDVGGCIILRGGELGS